MRKIDTNKLFSLLATHDISSKKASSFTDVIDEINKVSYNLKEHLMDTTAEHAIKKVLWQGILNQYGTFGEKSGQVREFKKKDKYGKQIEYNFNQSFTKGKLLSIDFGTSNIDREFALTHTGLVLADYNGLMIVVPLTSQSGFEYNNISPDIKNDILPIYKKDYPQIENDSYILIHQIRTVSKNRITKKGIIGSLANTDIMNEIESKIIHIISHDFVKRQQDKIKRLENEIEKLRESIDIK